MTYNASQRKSPVVYNLSDSKFIHEEGRYDFYFSSIKHLEKFQQELDSHEKWLGDSLSRRFHLNIEASDLADFQLYMQIEGRGFVVYDNLQEKFILSPDELCLYVAVI